jgi:hypothetical protein
MVQAGLPGLAAEVTAVAALRTRMELLEMELPE